MKTVILIILVIPVIWPVICFLYTIITSDDKDLRERVKEGADSAFTGFVVSIGWPVVLILPAYVLLSILSLFKQLFGN